LDLVAPNIYVHSSTVLVTEDLVTASGVSELVQQTGRQLYCEALVDPAITTIKLLMANVRHLDLIYKVNFSNQLHYTRWLCNRCFLFVEQVALNGLAVILQN
jgi:hypothetical protein